MSHSGFAAGKSRARLYLATPAPGPPLPSTKQLWFGWVCRSEDREIDQQAWLDASRNRNAKLSTTMDLAAEFAALIRKQLPETLTDWLAELESPACPRSRRFAEEIRSDEADVHAAAGGPWSIGPVESPVNWQKIIKRQLYGRAGFIESQTAREKRQVYRWSLDSAADRSVL
jgi:transposase